MFSLSHFPIANVVDVISSVFPSASVEIHQSINQKLCSKKNNVFVGDLNRSVFFPVFMTFQGGPVKKI